MKKATMISHTSSTVVEPKLMLLTLDSKDPLECSLHTLPKQLYREFKHVFGSKYLETTYKTEGDNECECQILAIPN